MDSSSLNVTIDDLVIDPAALSEAIRKSLTRDPFEHYVNGICGLITCLLGILSNALSFSVLIRPTMHLSTYVYLAALCLSDFITCLFLIPGYILDAYPIEIPDSDLPRTYRYTKLVIITGAISTTARALSVWLCLAFTIDRWIMICRPFVGPLYCTIKNARRVTLLIYLLSVFYAVPLLFEYEPHQVQGLIEILFAHHNKKFYRSKLTRFGQNWIFRWSYMLINALGVYVVPLLVIIIFNRKLLLSIRVLQRRSAEYNAPSPTKQGVTLMLVSTTISLLTLRAPSMIIYVMWLINAKMFVFEKSPFPLRKFHSIANLCATLNAATTFVMFMIYGTKFRSEFTRLYCRCCLTPPAGELDGQAAQKNHLDDEQHFNHHVRLLTQQGHEPRKTRHSSGATTTTSASIVSVQSLRRTRNQRRKPRYSLEMRNPTEHVSLTQTLSYELPTTEHACLQSNHEDRSAFCSAWLKTCVPCRE